MVVFVVTVNGRPDCAFLSQKLAAAFVSDLCKRQPSAKAEIFQLQCFVGGDDTGSPTSSSAMRKLR